VLIAVLLSFFILPKADKKFLPFILLLYAGLITEVINRYLDARGMNSQISTNIYALIEILLITWLFTSWNFFKDPKRGIWLSFLFIGVYIADIFFLPKLHNYTPYFNIFSSLVLVIMSILTINKVILIENKRLVKNATFWICMAFIIHFTNLALVEIFYIYGLRQGIYFADKIYDIFQVMNLITNLIYALAIIWIPRKQYSLI
jgi:hypothetical protein